MTYILEKNTHWQEKELNSESVVIPADWTSTALNTYADIISGQSPASDLVADLGLDFHQGNSLFGDKYIKPSTKKIDRTRAPKIAPAHSILFSVRAPVGEVNIACTEMCIGRGLAALTTEHVSEWMYFRLKSMSSVFKKLSTGTTFEGITAQNLGAVTFGCPPLNEQTAIANILSDQEALIAQYDNLIALHEKRFAYLSDELLSGRLRLSREVDGPVKISHNAHWHSLSINENECSTPEDWHVKNVSDLGYGIVTGKKDANAAVSGGAYTFFTCGEKDLAIDVYSFNTEALILNGNGNVGEVKMANGKFDAYQRNYVLTGGLPLKYGYYVFKHYFKDAVNLSGSVMPYITLKDLQKFDIRVPPLEEQTLIANVLSDQEALIAQYKKLCDAEKKRFDWLSDALLSGTYRVKVEA